MKWSLIVCADGEPVTGQVPCDDWLAACAASNLFACWLGGPVSVLSAVVANQPKDPTVLTLDLEVA